MGCGIKCVFEDTRTMSTQFGVCNNTREEEPKSLTASGTLRSKSLDMERERTAVCIRNVM